MSKILKVQEAIKIAKKLKGQNKVIVLVGGVFDILHIGHIKLIEKARRLGDCLFILLESDQTARKKKGKNRPINTQENRAIVLSSLASVDYVVILPEFTKNKEYDNLISKIRPSIIATTYKDPQKKHKKRQAKQINGKVAYVTQRISDQSTTKLAKVIDREDI